MNPQLAPHLVRQRLFVLWTALMRQLQITDAQVVVREFDRLCEMYSESHRRYHTLRHVLYCLTEFDWWAQFARKSSNFRLALWFHDAVHDPSRTDN